MRGANSAGSSGAIAAVPERPRTVCDATASVTSALRRARAPAEAATCPCQSASGPVPLTDSASGGRSVRASRRSSRTPVGSLASSCSFSTGVAPTSSVANSDVPGSVVHAVDVERDLRRLAREPRVPLHGRDETFAQHRRSKHEPADRKPVENDTHGEVWNLEVVGKGVVDEAQ